MFTLFTGAAYGILRSEGDAKRPMYAMGISAVLNMVLDPIFIYNAGWGIAGAAWATVISQLVVSLIIIYWFLAGKTFTSIGRGRFKPDRSIAWSIISVTVPASAEFFIMSMVTAVINWILVTAAGTKCSRSLLCRVEDSYDGHSACHSSRNGPYKCIGVRIRVKELQEP